MTMHNIQKQYPIEQLAHVQTNNLRLTPDSANTSLLSHIIPRIRTFLTKTSQQYKKENDNYKAIEHLQAMSDQELSDIGIKRQDISRAVHFGNDGI